VVAIAIYLFNAFFGERLERSWAQLADAAPAGRSLLGSTVPWLRKSGPDWAANSLARTAAPDRLLDPAGGGSRV
jgi:hypothetical protein